VKITLFTFVKPSATATMSTHRNSMFTAKELGLTLHWNSDVAKERPDLLVIFAGGMPFCQHLEALAKVVARVPRIVWACNDHTTRVPSPDSKGMSPFRRAFARRARAGLPHVDYWSTVLEHSKRTPRSCLVNWNALAYDPVPLQKDLPQSIIYYGSYRRDRLEILDAYLKKPVVQTTVSNASGRFEERYPKCRHVGSLPRPLSAALRAYGAGLYVDDAEVAAGKWSPPPANRFYEMLGAGMPMFIHPGARSLAQNGFDISPYVCEDAEQAGRMLRNRVRIAREQTVLWRRNYVEETRQGLLRALLRAKSGA
jgi:hypothetical protein